MRIVLALNMYHHKVRVLNAKFDIDTFNLPEYRIQWNEFQKLNIIDPEYSGICKKTIQWLHPRHCGCMVASD